MEVRKYRFDKKCQALSQYEHILNGRVISFSQITEIPENVCACFDENKNKEQVDVIE